IVAALALIGICFLPWIYIPSVNITLSGTNGKISDALTFGTQIKPHATFCILLILLFSINKVWAKRVNLFLGFLNLSWAIKNYIIFSMCRPDCPEVQPALYILVALALLVQIATFLPRVALKS
nr:hypothetical protein [Chitinophagaceae bacterium]